MATFLRHWIDQLNDLKESIDLKLENRIYKLNYQVYEEIRIENK